MKKIESKDLVIGQEYYDLDCLDLKKSAVLKFMGFDKVKDPYFKYVRGESTYNENEKGFIPMFKFVTFYQP